MTYAVKEIFLTVQGEGGQAGRPAVFLRFAGCNLWSGLERDRASAVCRFCDTDFIGTDGVNGAKFATAQALAAKIASLWPGGGVPYVVCTGGEPLLQLDRALIDALHDAPGSKSPWRPTAPSKRPMALTGSASARNPPRL